MKIVLCGMMGCGKTTVGRAVANRLEWAFADTDEWIVSRFGSIEGIFRREGEERFRALEMQAVRSALGAESVVISLGGGALLKAENVALLKADLQVKMIYLQAEAETLAQRLQEDESRPLLGKALPYDLLFERLENLLSQRSNNYENVADCVICVDEKSPAEIADEIVKKIHLWGAGIE